MFGIVEFIALIVVAGVFSVLWVSLRTGVPPAPSNAQQAAHVVALIRHSLADADTRPLRIFELGCGVGLLAWRLASAFPRAKIIAIERSPVPYIIATVVARFAGGRIEVRFGDYAGAAGEDLAGADAVTAYLMIDAMPKLARVLDAKVPAGCPVVVVSFWFRGLRPVATLPPVGDGRRVSGREVALYRWHQ